MKWKTVISSCLMLASCCLGHAQDEPSIDLGTIGEYSEIGKHLGYCVDLDEAPPVDSIPFLHFNFHQGGFQFDLRRLDANYFVKLNLENSGSPIDSFCLYVGQAMDFEIYDEDPATHRLAIHKEREISHSSLLMTDIPYFPVTLYHGQRKTFYIRPSIRFYNWGNFQPVIFSKKEAVNFASQHFMIPFRLNILITLPLLGIMFSIMAYTFTLYIRMRRREYFYYSQAVLLFIIDFGSTMVNNFSFSKLFHFFDIYRHHLLQVGGTILYILFISKFLNLKDHFPRAYRACWILIYSLLVFILLDSFFVFDTHLYYISHHAFNIVRAVVVICTLWLAIFLLFWNNRLARLVAMGAFCVSAMALFALYSLFSLHDTLPYLNLIGSSNIIFMIGIVLEMFFYVQAIAYRIRLEELERMKAVELLQIDNDRKELEKYKAIMEAKDKERNRIAQEMHDDIGSGLTSIRLLSEIAKARNQDQGMEEVEKISSSANTLIEKMNEIIWSMNSRNDSLPNLIAYIRHQVVEFFEPFTIKLRIFTPDDIPELPISGEMRRNIVLAVKEALHNIVKHANATAVEVHFRVDSDLVIFICDNGNGIDPNEIHHHNNGLRNMQERMKAIGGNFTLEGEIGTAVTFHIPIKTLL